MSHSYVYDSYLHIWGTCTLTWLICVDMSHVTLICVVMSHVTWYVYIWAMSHSYVYDSYLHIWGTSTLTWLICVDMSHVTRSSTLLQPPPDTHIHIHTEIHKCWTQTHTHDNDDSVRRVTWVTWHESCDMSHVTSHTTQAAAAGLLSLSHTHTLCMRDTVCNKSHVTQCVIKRKISF